MVHLPSFTSNCCVYIGRIKCYQIMLLKFYFRQTCAITMELMHDEWPRVDAHGLYCFPLTSLVNYERFLSLLPLAYYVRLCTSISLHNCYFLPFLDIGNPQKFTYKTFTYVRIPTYTCIYYASAQQAGGMYAFSLSVRP